MIAVFDLTITDTLSEQHTKIVSQVVISLLFNLSVFSLIVFDYLHFSVILITFIIRTKFPMCLC